MFTKKFIFFLCVIYIATFSIHCKSKDKNYSYFYPTPDIKNDFTHAGFKTISFPDADSYKKAVKKNYNFKCDSPVDTNLTRLLFTEKKKLTIKCFFPFAADSDSLDLGLNIFSEIDLVKDSVINSAAYLSGSDYPNGVLNALVNYSLNENVFSLTGTFNVNCLGNLTRIDKKENDRLVNYNFVIPKPVVSRMSEKSGQIKYSTPASLNFYTATSTYQLVIEFAFYIGENRGRIKIYKNGDILLNESFSFMITE
jgi:hypothetical protein